ncbi:MAG: hypothetical protein C4519_02950 [Desulfobacteraceae bacterium]|nr:MAG: hypothetical protein C4519_02950 [Desulfobacteraceae bacterium]
MEIYAALESLKGLILECDLPRTDLALFGIKCPYCGKSDRIHPLEPPQDLIALLERTQLERYSDLWQRLNPSQGDLGICKFCHNPLGLSLPEGIARTLDSA